ncbi:hypothetical protein AB0J72_29505 [Dactylosporangium sp. NPDC049742]|uniref:hypothetical protein n=1 Tax=Dactylosporangium sp. NPDC049742 TaxID=3154737 RepID=UPI00343E5A05
MRETQVEEEFARFAEEFTGTFRPLPVEDLPVRVTPGWIVHRLRGWLAGILVAAVTIGGGLALRTAGAGRPMPRPSGFQLVERPVVLDGATGPRQLMFTDSRHGWVLYNRCVADVCDPLLGYTDDGGLTWRARQLPRLGAAGVLYHALEREVWLTDGQGAWSSSGGGGTWTVRSRDDGPWTRSPVMLTTTCPQPPADSCTGRLLRGGAEDVGAVPARAGWIPAAGVRTADGHLWVVMKRHLMDAPSLLVHSADGTTWTDVREVRETIRLLLSPDQRELWYSSDQTGIVARLVDGRAVDQPPLPADARDAAALGGGRLLWLSRQDGRDGLDGLRLRGADGTEEWISIPLSTINKPTLQVLGDGSAVVGGDDGKVTTVGTVGGIWVTYT